MRKLLLVLGAPLWLPLVIVAFAVCLSLCLSLWAVLFALAVSAVGGLVYGGALIALGHTPTGLAFVSSGLVLVGLALLFLTVCKAVHGALVHPISLCVQRRRYRV